MSKQNRKIKKANNIGTGMHTVSYLSQPYINSDYNKQLTLQEIVEQQLPSLKKILAKKILQKQEHPETLWGNVMYNMAGRSYWKQMVRENSWIEAV